jgi:hypothetical protein
MADVEVRELSPAELAAALLTALHLEGRCAVAERLRAVLVEAGVLEAGEGYRS